jgi:P27 family predicted phage terminase small subunit
MKGRRTKTVAELKESGNYRPSRHGSRLKAAVALNEWCEPPAHFDKEHSEFWHAIVKRLKPENLFANVDYETLIIYVENWILGRRAFEIIKKHGPIVYKETPTHKVPIKNPALLVYNEAIKVCTMIGDKFGFSPRARQGIHVTPAKEQKTDPLKALLTNKSKSKTG